MTDETTYIDQDFSWDEPVKTEVSGGRKHFAKLRFLPTLVIPFQAGQSFTLPNVYDDKFDEATKLMRRQGAKEFKGMKLGKTDKKHTLNILVAEQHDKAGNAYQVVKQMKSWSEKGRKHVWADFQFPALKTLPTEAKATLLKGGAICVDFEDLGTQDFVEIAGSQQEVKYWGNFTVYPNEAALKEAETKFFAQFEGVASNGNGVDESNYPYVWKDQADKGTLYAFIKEELGKGNAPLKVAVDAGLITQPGNKPGVRLDGETPLDLPKLFGKATGQPAEMFTF